MSLSTNIHSSYTFIYQKYLTKEPQAQNIFNLIKNLFDEIAIQQNKDLLYRNKDFPGDKERVKIAKRAVQNYKIQSLKYIQNYGPIDSKALGGIVEGSVQTALIEIAKLSIENDSWATSYYIEEYGITDQKALIAIAKLAAQSNQDSGWGISQNIHKYKITDQNALIEIAKLAAQNNAYYASYGVSVHIQNYGITDQNALIEIAKLAAQSNPIATSQRIQNYGITDQNALIEIAKLAVQNDPMGTSQYIQNYGTTDQNALIEIAKLAAQKDPIGISKHIQNYGITNQNALIEIAKLAVQKNPMGTSQYIQNYGIADQNALIEIAKLAAQSNPIATSLRIRDYWITDQNALIEIAKLATQNNPMGTSKHIQNYGITNQNALIEIAKLAVQKNPMGTSQYIQNYGIADQNALIEVAKLAAQNDPMGTSQYIQNYRITDQNALGEIVKFAVINNSYLLKDSEMIVKCIQNYGITNQNALIEIAKLAVQKNPMGTSKHIQNYGITNQNALIEIAKLAVIRDPIEAYKYIQNYGITDQNALIEIAKLAVIRDPMEAYKYIQKYGITDQNALGEIATLAIQNNINAINLVIRKYGITDQKVVMQIAISAIKSYILKDQTFDLWQDLSKYPLSFLELYKLKIFSICSHYHTNTQLNCNEERELIRNNQSLDSFNEFQKEIEKYRKEKVQGNSKKALKRALIYFSSIAELCKNASISLNSNDQKYFVKALRHRNLKESSFLLQILMENLENTSYFTKKKSLTCNKSNNNKAIEHLILPMTLIAQWCTEESDLLENEIKMRLQSKDQRSSLRNAKGFLPNLLQALIALSLSDISPEEKLRLVNLCLQSSQEKNWEKICKRSLDTVKILADMQLLPRVLKKLDNNYSLDKINAEFEAYLQTEIFVFSKLMDNFNEKHLQVEASLRVPLCLVKYAWNLRTHQNPAVLKEMQRLVLNVFDGKIQKERYQTENNPHLHMIAENFPDIFKAWQASRGFASSLKNDKEKIIVIDTDDWQDLFLSGTEVLGSCQRIDGNPTFNACLMAYVLDGKNRMLAVKDSLNQEILARCILRLLWDTENRKPVLFQERIYPDLCSKEYEDLLNNLAEDRAKDLGVELFTVNSRKNLSSKKRSLESLGSCSPCEYSDACAGITNGMFTVHKAIAVNI